MNTTGVNLTEMASTHGEWLKGRGPEAGIVISSRVRLARNLAGFPFLNKCSDEEKQDIQEVIVAAINGTDLAGHCTFVNLDEAASLEKQLFVERHLISRQHADGHGPRGVAIVPDETTSIMINEEDHLRIQVLHSGL